MKVKIEHGLHQAIKENIIGNVYQRHGPTRNKSSVAIVVALVNNPDANPRHNGYTAIHVDEDGDIIGAAFYSLQYFHGRIPIARCDGVEDMILTIKSFCENFA